MKRTIIGLSFMGLGTYIFLTLHLYIIDMMQGPISWRTNLGPYISLLIDTYSIIPWILSIVLVIVGLIILLMDGFKKLP